jgi:hypothetical protein
MPHKVLIENIKFLKGNKTISEFGRNVCIDRRTVAAWFDKRKVLPSTLHLEKLSLLLNVSIDWICRVDLSKKTKRQIKNNLKRIDKKLTNGK